MDCETELPLPEFLMLCLRFAEEFSPSYFSPWAGFWKSFSEGLAPEKLPLWGICTGEPPLNWLAGYLCDFPDPAVMSIARLACTSAPMGESARNVHWSAFFLLSLFLQKPSEALAVSAWCRSWLSAFCIEFCPKEDFAIHDLAIFHARSLAMAFERSAHPEDCLNALLFHCKEGFFKPARITGARSPIMASAAERFACGLLSLYLPGQCEDGAHARRSLPKLSRLAGWIPTNQNLCPLRCAGYISDAAMLSFFSLLDSSPKRLWREACLCLFGESLGAFAQELSRLGCDLAAEALGEPAELSEHRILQASLAGFVSCDPARDVRRL